MSADQVIAYIIALLGGGSSIWTIIASRRKANAEAKKVVVEAEVIASTSAVTNLVTAMNFLNKRVAELSGENETLRSKSIEDNKAIALLQARIGTLEAHGIVDDAKIGELEKHDVEDDAKIFRLEQRMKTIQGEITGLEESHSDTPE